jgi:hypothetical protein
MRGGALVGLPIGSDSLKEHQKITIAAFSITFIIFVIAARRIESNAKYCGHTIQRPLPHRSSSIVIQVTSYYGTPCTAIAQKSMSSCLN